MQFQSANRPHASNPKAASAYVPRRLRSRLRADAAMERGKRAGTPMLQNVEAMIAATGGAWWEINNFKTGVESLIHSGSDKARMLYGDIARALPHTLDGALVEVERAHRAEQEHLRQLAGYVHGSRHHGMCLNRLDRLRKIRVILRLMRAAGLAEAFPELRDVVGTEIPLVEAMRSFHQQINPTGYRR